MTENPVNVVLAALLAVIFSGAALIRLSPPQMKALADWLNARADSEEYFAIRKVLYKTQRDEREGSGGNG